MLNLTGNGTAHTCDGTTRRDFMQVGSLGVSGLSLSGYLQAEEQGQVASGHEERSCIMIFNLGAPSQFETWDPKPDAVSQFRGPFGAISTSMPGVLFSETLPESAKVMDQLAILRSVRHGSGDQRATDVHAH